MLANRVCNGFFLQLYTTDLVKSIYQIRLVHVYLFFGAAYFACGVSTFLFVCLFDSTCEMMMMFRVETMSFKSQTVNRQNNNQID